MSASSLTLLVREECGLCEEFLAELTALGTRMTLPAVAVVDVDSDPQLQRRHGLDVPVLLLDGVRVCAHRLDAGELARLLRPRGGPKAL